MMDNRAATPAAANNLLRMLRILAKFAIEEEWRDDDPTAPVRPIKTKSDGFHTWTEDEIGQFEARRPIGTKERLAFALLLCTGQRRSDVVRMGRQHFRGDAISVRQQKTGKQLVIPVHSHLRHALDAGGMKQLTFLTTAYGAPFTPAGFGNWFRATCNEAGLSHCSAHGLRKAAARRLAEAGCSANMIAAITGHDTLKQVEGYTRAADQRMLAEDAIRAVEQTERERNLANHGNRLAKNDGKSLK